MSDINHTRDCILPSDGKAEGLVKASELFAIAAERDALRAENERLRAALEKAKIRIGSLVSANNSLRKETTEYARQIIDLEEEVGQLKAGLVIAEARAELEKK